MTEYTLWKYAFLSLIFLGSYGCGFHLRTPTPLPPTLKEIYIDDTSPYDPFVQALQNTLEDAAIVVSDTPKTNITTLHIIQQSFSKKMGGISTSTNTRQYTLYYMVQFELISKEKTTLIAPTRLSTSKTLTINSNQILGSSAEEETLKREMQQTLAEQLLRHLRLKPPLQSP